MRTVEMQLFNVTNKAAYFMWDATKHENALEVWYCVEDLASYLERNNVTSEKAVGDICALDKKDARYLDFFRNAAYRIYIHTNTRDALANWFDAENLFKNAEFTEAILEMAKIYRDNKSKAGFSKNIRSASIKEYYTFHQDF
jgi:hypothetical protein